MVTANDAAPRPATSDGIRAGNLARRLIVVGGCTAVEQAAKSAGYDITVPVTSGRRDAAQKQTDALAWTSRPAWTSRAVAVPSVKPPGKPSASGRFGRTDVGSGTAWVRAGKPGAGSWQASPGAAREACRRGALSLVPGGRHRGPRGAAGLLPWAVTPDGRTWVLLSHRPPHVQAGGTWSTFGGAIDPGETPRHAALRATSEEIEGIDVRPDALAAGLEVPCEHGCGWSCTTFAVRVRDTGAGDLSRVRVAPWHGRGRRPGWRGACRPSGRPS